MEKIKADLIISHGSIITMNSRDEILADAAIVIQGSKIAAIGPAGSINAQYSAAENIDASDTVIIPGLVDTHYHTAQQLERAMLYHLGHELRLKEPVWLRYLIPFEANLTDEDLYLGAMLGYANQLKVGTTCFADPGGPRPEFAAAALEKVGNRGALAASTIDLVEGVPPEMYDTPAGVREKGERFFKAWNGKAGGRVRVWMAMRQLMICSEEMMRTVHDVAAELNTGLHIHLGEGTYEVDFAIEKSGLRPAEYLDSIGFLGPNVLAAHSVYLSDHDLDLYQKHDISVAHCPTVAFQYMGPTRVPEMLRRNIRVGMGTDGALSSGGSLDLFRQMHISQIALGLTFGVPFRNYAMLQHETLLKMATLGGARALRWDDEIGSLEVGKKADLLLLDCTDLDVLPAYDPLFAASSNASGAQVKTVLVDGKVMVKNRELVNVDEAELKAKVKERAPKIISRFLERIQS